MPSQPPPPPPGGATGGSVRPMSPFAATGWALGTMYALMLLVHATQSLRSGAANDVVSFFTCQVAVYLLALFFILRIHAPEASIRSFLAFRPTHVGFYPIAIAMGAAIQYPVNAIFDVIIKRYPLGEADDDALAALYADSSSAKRIALGFIVVALGPLIEEIFFRGVLWKPVRAAQSAALTILLSAALFAFAHEGWQRAVPIGLVGIALGYLRSASGSLVVSVLMHATFNALPFYQLATEKAGAEEAPMSIALALGGGVFVAILLGLVSLISNRSEVAITARRKDAT